MQQLHSPEFSPVPEGGQTCALPGSLAPLPQDVNFLTLQGIGGSDWPPSTAHSHCGGQCRHACMPTLDWLERVWSQRPAISLEIKKKKTEQGRKYTWEWVWGVREANGNFLEC